MSDDRLDQLVDAEGAARILGLKVSTIRRLTSTRELPVVRPTDKRAVRCRLTDPWGELRMRSQPVQTARGGR